jgi:hypothetical protein
MLLVENSARQVRRFTELKSLREQRWRTKFSALFLWTRAVRIRRRFNVSQWKNANPSHPVRNVRQEQLAPSNAL